MRFLSGIFSGPLNSGLEERARYSRADKESNKRIWRARRRHFQQRSTSDIHRNRRLRPYRKELMVPVHAARPQTAESRLAVDSHGLSRYPRSGQRKIANIERFVLIELPSALLFQLSSLHNSQSSASVYLLNIYSVFNLAGNLEKFLDRIECLSSRPGCFETFSNNVTFQLFLESRFDLSSICHVKIESIYFRLNDLFVVS